MRRAGLELRVELRGKEERVVLQLEAFHPVPVGRREYQAGLFQVLYVPRVHLVPVPVPLGDLLFLIETHRQGVFPDVCRVIAEAHRAAKLMESFLFGKESNYMGALPEFLAGGVSDAELVAGIFDDSQLEPQAEPKEGYFIFAGKPDCFDLAFDAPLAEPSGNQDAVIILELAAFVTFSIQPARFLPQSRAPVPHA